MRSTMAVVVGGLISGLLTGGCGHAYGVHEMLPPAGYAPPSLHPKEAVQLEIFDEITPPGQACIRIAALGAHGNAYATRLILETQLRIEAEQVDADFIVITGSEIRQGETVGSIYAGVFVASTIRRPSLYGVACRASRIRMGVHIAADRTIRYVYPNSLAERIGLREGDRLLAVNGGYLEQDAFAMDRELFNRSPGETVTLQYLTRDGAKKTISITLE